MTAVLAHKWHTRESGGAQPGQYHSPPNLVDLIPGLPVSWTATLVSDREDSKLIACLTVNHREREASAEYPAITGFQHCSRFGINHRGLDDDHDLFEGLTAKPWHMVS